MHFSFYWISVGVCFTLTWTTTVEKIPRPEKGLRIKREWERCCQRNVCIQNSCFINEWRASKWAAVRQRCQAKYPEWPYAIDIFRIQQRSDIDSLSKFLRAIPEFAGEKSLWTSGVRCPRTGSEGPILVTRWASSNLPFPDWLNDEINTTSTEIVDVEEGCKFLVIYLEANNSEVKYDFQAPTARHAAICEFVLPGEIETTPTTVFTELTTNKTPDINGENENRSKTMNPAEIMETSTKSTHSTTKSTSKPSTKSTVAISTSTHIKEKDIATSTESEEKFCKGKKSFGIEWPDTTVGETANMSCPEGMTGYAQWKCSEITVQFIPDKPHIQDCKHIWIKSLEDEVDKGSVSALIISHKLANETKEENMSHGDITALVDLSSKIFRLYIKQNEEKFDETKHEEKPLSYNFTGHMVSSISNILRAEIKEAWENLPEIHQTRAASKILEVVTKMGTRLSCFRSSSEKLQFTVTAENIGLQTFVLDSTSTNKNEIIVFPERVPGVKFNSSLLLPANQNFKGWYSSCKSLKTAVGILYNHVGDFLKDETVKDNKTHVATKVISFTLGNNTDSVPLKEGNNVTVILRHLLQKDIEKGRLKNPRCMFWNFSRQSYGQWDDAGCHRVYSNLTHTVCTCNHLTNFAVLMDVNNNIQEDATLSLMTYICCGFSSVSLVITLICFLSIRSLYCRRSIITGNLCFSLLFVNLLIIFGLDRTENKVMCATIAGLLHFWVLSSFFWMLVEGYHLYKMVILVFQRGSDLSVKFYYFFAYGCPLVIVAVSAAIRTDYYGGDKYCWLSSNQGFMWSFVGPACAVILVNGIVFFLTLRSASSVRIKREQTTVKKIKNWARGSMSVMCLLGLTWCLGLLYIDAKLHIMSYVFTLTNGLQGVFIFIFHILLNEKVQACCFAKWKGIKQNRFQNFPTTSSNRLNSKTSTRTSLHSNGCTATTVMSRTGLTGVTSTSKLSREKKGNPIDSNIKNKNPKSNISNRKYRADRILSENGRRQLPPSGQNKARSHSLTNEAERFPITPHLRPTNGFIKHC